MLGDDGREPRYAVARVLGAQGAADSDTSGRHPFHKSPYRSEAFMQHVLRRLLGASITTLEEGL
jgi:hypothetical protein